MTQQHRTSKEVIDYLLNPNPEDRMRFEKCLSALQYCGLDPQELKQELFLKILSGVRNCPKDVEIMAFAINTAKSLAYNAHRKNKEAQKIFRSAEFLDDSLPLSEENDLETTFMNVRSFEESKQFLREQLCNDEALLDYILRRISGDNKSEIMQEMGIDNTEFETIRRRAKRTLGKMARKE